MSQTTYDKIIQNCKSGNFAPVYFLHGDEKFLIRSALEALIEAAVDEATRDFNFDRFRGSEASAERVYTAVRTGPMMAERRVVLVSSINRADSSVKDVLAEYSSSADSSVLLIVTADERVKVDKRRKSPKWAATLEQNAASVCFWPPRENEVLLWISSRAVQKGKKIGRGAAFELYKRTGARLDRLDDELEKLSLYIGSRDEVNEADIRNMSGIAAGGTVFDWVDAIASGETDRAGSVGKYLLSMGESAVGAVAIAGNHFVSLGKIISLLSAGRPEREITNKLGLAYRPQEAVKRMFVQARQYNRSRYSAAMGILLDADMKLKSSRFPDSLVLDNLAFRFAGEVFKK